MKNLVEVVFGVHSDLRKILNVIVRHNQHTVGLRVSQERSTDVLSCASSNEFVVGNDGWILELLAVGSKSEHEDLGGLVMKILGCEGKNFIVLIFAGLDREGRDALSEGKGLDEVDRVLLEVDLGYAGIATFIEGASNDKFVVRG